MNRLDSWDGGHDHVLMNASGHCAGFRVLAWVSPARPVCPAYWGRQDTLDREKGTEGSLAMNARVKHVKWSGSQRTPGHL